MTMTSARPEPEDSTTAHKLAIIEYTYPAWRVRQWPNDMWTATRVSRPTPAQAAAGLHRCILQPGLDALCAVLCQQLYIVQTLGRT